MRMRTRSKICRAVPVYLAVVATYTVVRIPAGILVLSIIDTRGTPDTIAHAMRYVDPVVYLPFWLLIRAIEPYERTDAYTYIVLTWLTCLLGTFAITTIVTFFQWLYNGLRSLFGSFE